MNKKVSFNNPRDSKNNRNAEQWVKNRNKMQTPMKRLTLDIPEQWHIYIKTKCAKKGVKMIDEILPILQKHFSALE